MGVTTFAQYVPAQVPLPGAWTFWADTIVGSVPLGPLQPNGFSYTSRLSAFGHGQVTLPAEPGGIDTARLLRLWSWRLWSYYDGQLVWCGVPTGVSDDDGNYVTLTLTELTGYLAKRQFDVYPHQRFSQVEQTEIARQIAAPVADVGVRLVVDPGSGQPRDRLYEYLEGDRARLLGNLSEVINGPQFRTTYGMTAAGLPECVLRIGYPRVGAQTQLVLAVPGAAVDYRAQWDSDKLRTRTFSVGELPEDAPEGTPKPVVVEDRPQPDLPRLDEADDWPGTILVSTLRERALTAAGMYAAPVLDLSARAGLASPPLGGYAVGDDVTVRLVTPFMPGGIDATGQLTEITVSAGEATAHWTVTLALPPPRPRETLTRRLGRIDATLTGVFRRRLSPV